MISLAPINEATMTSLAGTPFGGAGAAGAALAVALLLVVFATPLALVAPVRAPAPAFLPVVAFLVVAIAPGPHEVGIDGDRQTIADRSS